MRRTKNDLYFLINNINSKLNLDDGDKLILDFSYGGVRLCKYTNECGGKSELSERVTVSEMYTILYTLETTVYKFELKK